MHSDANITCSWCAASYSLSMSTGCCDASLLWQAAQQPKGSIERLLLVAAFAQSAFQAVGKLKCMVPTMSETYEVRLLIFALWGVLFKNVSLAYA